MIYTRFFTPVNLLTCRTRMIKDRRGQWQEITVTAEQSAPHPHDGSGHVGRPILDGMTFSIAELKADNGLGEILDACHALNPEVMRD